MGNDIFHKHESWRRSYNSKLQRMQIKICAEDNQEFRDGYPGKLDDPTMQKNYLFLTNQIVSQPDGDYIDNILNNWWGDYKKLENHHGYIQWLFPTRDCSYNKDCQSLQLHEVDKIKADSMATSRFLKAYDMMLDFYGIRLISPKRGTLDRAEHWPERNSILQDEIHNYLRITRMLKSMAELGFENLQYGLINFLFEEVMVNQIIPDAIESLHDYWIETLRDDTSRRVMHERFKALVKNYPEQYDRKRFSKERC